ncbi:MAG TPA: serine protease, partial [Myxococcaceae bacterium]|nr:serine protease [Myxococcaceae bacterium]
MNRRVSLRVGLLLLSAACSTIRPSSVGAASGAARPEGGDRKSVLRRILPQNVRLFVFEGDQPRRSASGVVIGSEATSDGAFSYVLTSAHAVAQETPEEQRMVVYVDRDGDSFDYSARPVVVGKVPELDLALIRVRGVSLAAAELAQDCELEAGEDVVVVAAPYGKSLSVSGGLISQVEWDRKSGAPAMLKTD